MTTVNRWRLFFSCRHRIERSLFHGRAVVQATKELSALSKRGRKSDPRIFRNVCCRNPTLAMTTVDRQHLFFTWLAVDLTLKVLIAHQMAHRLKPWRYWTVWSGLGQYTGRYLAQIYYGRSHQNSSYARFYGGLFHPGMLKMIKVLLKDVILRLIIADISIGISNSPQGAMNQDWIGLYFCRLSEKK